jgi:hypothetical protein
MNSPISITFGKPIHGWLSVDFHYKDVRLSFDASDGINNPIKELYNAIANLQDNEKGTVTWWLEPGAYFFDFEKKRENTVLTILETEDLHALEVERKSILTISSPNKQVTEPFYVALMELCSQKYQQEDWSYNLIHIR